MGPTNLAVRVGSSYHASGGSVIRINQINQHRYYNARTQDYDFSLLQLAQTLTYTNSIKPVTLPTASTRVADGTNSLVSGWGKLNFNFATKLNYHDKITDQILY